MIRGAVGLVRPTYDREVAMSGMLSPSEIQSLFSGFDLSRTTGGQGLGETSQAPSPRADQFTLPLSLAADERADLEIWLAAIADRWQLAWPEAVSGRWSITNVTCQATRLRNFAATHENWRCFQIVAADSDLAHWLAVDACLAESHLNALLGAADHPGMGSSPRNWGPVEHQLTCRLVQSMVAALFPGQTRENQAGWKFAAINSDEDWVTAVPVFLSCELIQLDVELNCCGSTGRLCVGLPRSLVHRCLNRDESLAATPDRPAIRSNAKQAMLRATLMPITLSVEEFGQLQVGDVLLTGQDAEATCALSIDGETRYRATIGSHQSHKAVRLVSDKLL